MIFLLILLCLKEGDTNVEYVRMGILLLLVCLEKEIDIQMKIIDAQFVTHHGGVLGVGRVLHGFLTIAIIPTSLGDGFVRTVIQE